MKFAEWARRNGVHPQTAYRWFREGTMPVPARRLPSGTILVDVADTDPREQVVVYARVSSADQKADLDRQVARVTAWATGQQLAVSRVVTEVGSALNGRRKKFLALLRDPAVSTIVVEHRDRFARFGAEYVEAALAAQGRRLLVVDPAEVDDDLVRDVTEILTSLCARLYGRRAAANRARRAVAAATAGDDRRDSRSRRTGSRWTSNADAGTAVLAARRGRRGSRTTGRWPGQGGDGPARRGDDLRRAGRPADAVRVSWSLPALRKAWNAAKAEVAPWWAECSKEAFNTGLDAPGPRPERTGPTPVAGKRNGPPGRVPAVQVPAAAARQSCGSRPARSGSSRTGSTSCCPGWARLKLHESARKLARRLEAGTARIMSATVRRDGGRWHVAFTVEVDRPITRPPARPGSVVGVDVGIKHLAVLSTGELVANPRHLAAAHTAAARSAGRCRARPARTGAPAGEPSKRWQTRQAARLAGRTPGWRTCAATACTSSPPGWPREHGTVVVEDLNVAGMLANRRLARHIADAGFAEIRRQLAYKTTWNGGRLIVGRPLVSRRKTCSGCGAVKAKLPLRVRTFNCDACGLVLDRDLNAARNLARLVERERVPEWPETRSRKASNGRGADRKTPLAGQVAVKRPPRPGTVGRQRPTADRELTFAH